MHFVKILTDWNYLYALNEIDKLNQKKKEKIQTRVKWLQRYLDFLHFYSFCVVSDMEGCGLNCQVTFRFHLRVPTFDLSACPAANLDAVSSDLSSFCRHVGHLLQKRLCNCFAMKAMTMTLWNLRKCDILVLGRRFMLW